MPSPRVCTSPRPRCPALACPALQERSLAGRLFQTIPKVLNVGLLVAALFHILELGSLLVDRGVEVGAVLPCAVQCCALLCRAVLAVAALPTGACLAAGSESRAWGMQLPASVVEYLPRSLCLPPAPAVALAAARPVCPLGAGAAGRNHRPQVGGLMG